MSLITEDGTGLPNADSYVTLAEANAFMADDIHASGLWDDTTDDVKEAVIRFATSAMDTHFDYPGRKVYSTGSLRWPRSGVSDLDGNSVSSASVPKEIKKASVRYAYEFLKADRVSDPESKGVSRITIDSIDIRFDKGDRPGVAPSSVVQMLRGFASLRTGSKFGVIRRA